MRLGDGWNSLQDLSTDKKWIVQVDRDKNLLNLLPVGPGESKTIQDKDFKYRRALWFPDGKRILVTASTPGHGFRVYARPPGGAAAADHARRHRRCAAVA